MNSYFINFNKYATLMKDTNIRKIEWNIYVNTLHAAALLLM